MAETTKRLCTWCRGPNARFRCRRCGTWYCDRACQRHGWRLHKKFCSTEDGDAVVVEHAVERAVALELAREGRVPRDVQCFICLEGGPGLMSQGCACRGASGYAHADCLEKLTDATPLDTLERQRSCGTCRQWLGGALGVEMIRRFWRVHRKSTDGDVARKAALKLAMCLLKAREGDAIDVLHGQASAGLRANDPARLACLIQEALELNVQFRRREGLDLLEKAMPQIRRFCDAADLGKACVNMAIILSRLGSYAKSLAYAKEAINIFERTEGPDSAAIHAARRLYAMVLAHNGRVQESQAMLADLSKMADASTAT